MRWIKRTRWSMSLVLLAAAQAGADSLFTPAASRVGTFVAERKARFAPGDIITVLIREKIESKTISDTNTKKESNVESEANETDNTFLAAQDKGALEITEPNRLPNWNIEMKNEHKTTGQERRSSTLETTVSCTVMEIFPNETIAIKGERHVKVNREDSEVVLTGVIRSKDVSAANTIPSTLIANAKMELKGKGPLWNNNRRGWMTRLLDWVSPY